MSCGCPIVWYKEDEETWYGFTCSDDEATFVVLTPEPGVWAGWQYDEDGGDRHCITMDFETASDARESVDRIYRTVPS